MKAFLRRIIPAAKGERSIATDVLKPTKPRYKFVEEVGDKAKPLELSIAESALSLAIRAQKEGAAFSPGNFLEVDKVFRLRKAYHQRLSGIYGGGLPRPRDEDEGVYEGWQTKIEAGESSINIYAYKEGKSIDINYYGPVELVTDAFPGTEEFGILRRCNIHIYQRYQTVGEGKNMGSEELGLSIEVIGTKYRLGINSFGKFFLPDGTSLEFPQGGQHGWYNWRTGKQVQPPAVGSRGGF